MSDKVYSAKELKYRFKVKILGILPQAGKKKAGRIDRLISRLEGRILDRNVEREYGLIVANICNYAEGAKSLLVVGSGAKNLIEEVGENLKGRLPDVKIVPGGNLLTEAESLKRLPECDSVVLVEQCGSSLYSLVEQEIEKIRDMDKKVVGCVVFE